ncbi:hypothetical protein [Devosia sp. 1566]|uniref:hypothetical protein n=1 Tax=Devosia sp. 1566 TaxID=2499144 RepID=UPI000FD78355|nr:hypothetical protein [Devosia sp. 1566]
MFSCALLAIGNLGLECRAGIVQALDELLPGSISGGAQAVELFAPFAQPGFHSCLARVELGLGSMSCAGRRLLEVLDLKPERGLLRPQPPR